MTFDASHSPGSSGDPDASASAAPPDGGAGGATGDLGGGGTGLAAGPGPDLHRLRRARHGRMIGGVAAGLAECFGVDVTLVRVAAVVMALLGGLAVPVYLALWLLVPEEGTDYTILSNVIPGFFGPRPVNAQGGAAMSPCSPFSEPTEERRWQASNAGPQYGGRWRGGWTDSGHAMRVGDAERSQVSEVLSKHYAAGRLDDEEFNQRMGQAMGAKTRSDLSGLLVDLPSEQGDRAVAHRHRFGFGRFVMAAIVFLVVASIVSSIWAIPHFTGAWIAVAVLAFFLLRWERHRHWHRTHSG